VGRTWQRRPKRRSPWHAKQKRMAFVLRLCCSTQGREPHASGCNRHPRMCGDKAGFERPSEAESQSRDLAATTGAAWRAYCCPWCGLFHLTTQESKE